MKTISKRFLFTVLLSLSWIAAFADDGADVCPCGVSDGTGGTQANPPPPPGQCLPCPVPLDESVMVLVIIALVFGIYIIYNNSLKTKNSI